MDKKKKNYFVLILLISFAFFLIVYLSKEAGYYEYKMYTKTRLTEESILKFEEDVNQGKDVSIEDYIVNDFVDYSNTFTDIGSSIGMFIEDIMHDGIEKTLKVLGSLFYE